MHGSLEISQIQKIALTTELIQHLEILHYSGAELEGYIYEKANDNPLLHVEDSKFQKSYKDVLQLASVFSNNRSSNHSEKIDLLQTRLTQKDSFEAYLLEQIPLHQNLSKKDLSILKYLICSLDDRLFLDIELDEVAEKFETTNEHVEVIIDLFQTFEPIGVGARSFTDYLLIQIDRDLTAPPLAVDFVKFELENMASLSLKILSKKYRTAIKETQRTLNYIRNLNPLPISEDMFKPIQYIVPDAEVIKRNDQWIIQLNRKYLPTVSISKTYVDLLKSDPDPKTKKYYQDCLKDALLLMQGIEQRDKTIYALLRVLLEKQQDFFEKGMQDIKPMRLKDVSIILGVHESTISRTIRSKYIRTPHGTYALQSLFTKGFVSNSGKMDSVSYVKRRIKELIDSENPDNRYSDQQITDILGEEDIQISRRTVAKYREELNIFSSSKRVYISIK
ncbi:RNA polymerase factor sigma-54 [Psychrobacillus sp. INOP01]|uniref:RNA polymerase factor sigma-54 n=1 Tax=Psychrobacillus sp. INOP01 TaxID=2829187 RepID=UPI001BACA53F|nr:RNA polymerase factor sigma-54 [Psychrobacillus sp. INOP01]QUG40610.1 RNA polymerase factor sigma-54 [Psychrobacillus sp. INOP01]